MCRSRRELSNAYFLAKFGFDTAENEPCQARGTWVRNTSILRWEARLGHALVLAPSGALLLFGGEAADGTLLADTWRSRDAGEALGTTWELRADGPWIRSEVNIELNFPPKLRGARSRLYRRRFLQVNSRWKALAEIYTMHSFAPFSNIIFFVKNC